jgi:hypothetical protein
VENARTGLLNEKDGDESGDAHAKAMSMKSCRVEERSVELEEEELEELR